MLMVLIKRHRADGRIYWLCCDVCKRNSAFDEMESVIQVDVTEGERSTHICKSCIAQAMKLFDS